MARYITLCQFTDQFPDDETATAFNLKLASAGNVRTTTMRAFDADEMTSIIGKTK